MQTKLASIHHRRWQYLTVLSSVLAQTPTHRSRCRQYRPALTCADAAKPAANGDGVSRHHQKLQELKAQNDEILKKQQARSMHSTNCRKSADQMKHLQQTRLGHREGAATFSLLALPCGKASPC